MITMMMKVEKILVVMNMMVVKSNGEYGHNDCDESDENYDHDDENDQRATWHFRPSFLILLFLCLLGSHSLPTFPFSSILY